MACGPLPSGSKGKAALAAHTANRACFSAAVTASHVMVTRRTREQEVSLSLDWGQGSPGAEQKHLSRAGWQAGQGHMSSVIPPKSQPLQSLSQSDLWKPRYRESPLSWVAQGVSSRSGPGSQASWLGLYSGHLTTSGDAARLSTPNPSRKRWLALGFQQMDSSRGLLCPPGSSHPEPQFPPL